MWPVCTCSVDYTDIPEREYYVAPRKNRRRRHLRLLPFLLALLLFGSGFLLGRTQAAQMLTPDSNNAGFPTQPSNSANEKCGIIPTTPATTDADTNVNEEPVDNWELVLVNERNPLSKDFSVPKLTRLKNRQSIDSRAYPALQKMMDAARSAGYEPLICSSYRTWDKQNELFQRKVFFYMDQGYSRAEAETRASSLISATVKRWKNGRHFSKVQNPTMPRLPLSLIRSGQRSLKPSGAKVLFRRNCSVP